MSSDATTAIRVGGLSKNFGPVQAVSGLAFTVRAGKVVALLGPNGAGKSTTISMLLGLARPDAGAVEVFLRNYLSAAIGKTGTRNRIEAAHTARANGWL